MLLTIDIGNTSTSFGVFKGGKLKKMWRCDTDKIKKRAGVQACRRVDVFQRLHACTPARLHGVIISSVVPKADKIVQKMVQKLFKLKPIFITHKNAGIKIGYPRPKEIGADRLVNAVYVWEKYHKACIVVDFGTATTLDYIDSKGVYWGGPIAPGIGIANSALYQAAAKLPRVKISAVKRMLPRSTKEAMQSGVYQGYIGLIEHLIRRMVKETGEKSKVIATGGYAKLLAKGTNIFDEVDNLLTLKGLLLCSGGLQAATKFWRREGRRYEE